MKKLTGIILISLAFVLQSNMANSQVVVKVKPAKPKVVIVKADVPKPGPNHIWIDGHWTCEKKTKSYVWKKGHWVKPKKGKVWIPGHWKKVPGGHKWMSGHWKRV